MPAVELPLISTSPTTSPDALVRAVKRADAILARTGTAEQQLDVASVYTSAERAGIAAVNRAFDLRMPVDGSASAAAVLKEVDAVYAEAGTRCLIMDTNETSWPEGLPDAITSRGYRAETCTVQVLQGYATPAEGEALQIIPARAAYGEARGLFLQQASQSGWSSDDADAFADTGIDYLDEPRVDCFIARRNRVSIGHISLLTLGNIGVLLDLFIIDGEGETTRDALLSRLVDHCLRAQFEQVVTRTTESEPRRAFLESRGFTPRVQYVRFVK